MPRMTKKERAYRDFYCLSDDEPIDEDDLATFDPNHPPRDDEPCDFGD